MKILSGPEGEGLLTNVEVLEWLKDKNFSIPRRDVPDGVIKPPSSTSALAKGLRRYLEACPSGTQTSKSARLLFEKLEKFNLSTPELMMIVNIRPEAYAHLTALIADVYSRFDEDQIYEILEIVNGTLEKRVKRKQPEESEPLDPDQNFDSQTEQRQDQTSQAHTRGESHENLGIEEVSAQITDISAAVQSAQVQPQEVQETEKPTDGTFEDGMDATITDYTVYADTNTPNAGRSSKSRHRTTR